MDNTNSNNNSSPRNNKKRKRGKSVLQNARKYLKKGVCGRGRELETDTYQYLVRILEVYKEGFPGDEERSIFANNVFQEAENNEVLYASNQLGSRVMQMLLPHANDEALERYIKAFMLDLRPICSDRFASHVLQTLFEILCKKSFQLGIDTEFKNRCVEYTIKVSKFLLNNLEDFASDTYGCHIIRTIFKSLVNLPVDNGNGKAGEKQNDVVEIPEEYKEIMKDYAQRLIAWPQFINLPYSELTSGLLQVLLRALHKIDLKLLDVYIKKLLSESFSSDAEEDDSKEKTQESKLADVFMSKPALMLMEVALEVASAKRYTQIYAKYFINNLVQLSVTRNTNFCVQKLLQHCKEKTEFEAIFDELSDQFKEIIDAGHTGVILSIAQACKRLAAKQGTFVQNIMKCFNCYEPEEHQNSIVMCACRFVYYEELSKEAVDLQKAKLNLHGTLIVQLMLEFNKPIKIVNSILSIDTTDLKNLFSNSMGSHIVDSYVKSQFVGEKSREKLIRKMQGTYQDLASTKYGSRSFEAIWNVANLKFKMSIMNELSHKDAAWSNSEFGKIIASKVNLVLYKRSADRWKDSLNTVSKKQALFADIIET